MSNVDDKMFEITSANQDLFMELDEKDAETVSGGYEVFTIKNETKYDLVYLMDGHNIRPILGGLHKSGQDVIWTAYSGGIIKFDEDMRAGFIQYKTYNLSHGERYVFRENTKTTGNPHDIDIYRVV